MRQSFLCITNREELKTGVDRKSPMRIISGNYKANYLWMKTGLLFAAVLFLSVNLARSQDFNVKTPLLGVEVPSFRAESTQGTINFPADFGRNWKILFSHPKDFTPVCSSELLELAYQQEGFDELGASVVVLSTDILSQHRSWVAALEEIPYKDGKPVKISFPLISDAEHKVSNMYGMIHSAESIGENIRAVFIIDPDNKVRAINYYPNEVGRNIDELKRTLIALQTTHKRKDIATPANWQPGDDLLVPILSSADRANIGTPGSPFYQWSWFMTFVRPE